MQSASRWCCMRSDRFDLSPVRVSCTQQCMGMSATSKRRMSNADLLFETGSRGTRQSSALQSVSLTTISHGRRRKSSFVTARPTSASHGATSIPGTACAGIVWLPGDCSSNGARKVVLSLLIANRRGRDARRSLTGLRRMGLETCETVPRLSLFFQDLVARQLRRRTNGV